MNTHFCDSFFYKDKVEISFTTNIASKILFMIKDKLIANCDNFIGPKLNKKYGAGCFIKTIMPNKVFFEILASYENKLGPYSIHDIEIAGDFVMGTKKDTMESADAFARIISVKQLTEYIQFTSSTPEPEKGKYGLRSHYFQPSEGKFDSSFVIYPRMAKEIFEFAKLPSVHFEFRYRHRHNIKRHTGIVTFSDAANADDEKLFYYLFNKKVLFCTINHLKHARYVDTSQSKPPLTKDVLSSDGAINNWLVEMSQLFCKQNKITNYTQLYKYYSKRKSRLRKRIVPGYKIHKMDVIINRQGLYALRKNLPKEQYMQVLFGNSQINN